MFIETVAGNIVLAVATVINIGLRIYIWLIIIRVIASWIM